MSNLALYAAATAVNLSKTDIFPHEETMIWAAKNMMPPLVGAMLLAGVMAAALSSATTFLSLVGFSVSNDVFPGGGLCVARSGVMTSLERREQCQIPRRAQFDNEQLFVNTPWSFKAPQETA